MKETFSFPPAPAEQDDTWAVSPEATVDTEAKQKRRGRVKRLASKALDVLSPSARRLRAEERFVDSAAAQYGHIDEATKAFEDHHGGMRALQDELAMYQRMKAENPHALGVDTNIQNLENTLHEMREKTADVNAAHYHQQENAQVLEKVRNNIAGRPNVEAPKDDW